MTSSVSWDNSFMGGNDNTVRKKLEEQRLNWDNSVFPTACRTDRCFAIVQSGASANGKLLLLEDAFTLNKNGRNIEVNNVWPILH
ncbi:hypothetical protein MTO96_005759 [Rhipicephalus appendiculatus]